MPFLATPSLDLKSKIMTVLAGGLRIHWRLLKAKPHRPVIEQDTLIQSTRCIPEAHRIRLRRLAASDLLRPDPLQGLAELPLTHRSWCPLLLEDAANPPDLKTAKGKGDQTQLDISPVQVFDHVGCCAFRHQHYGLFLPGNFLHSWSSCGACMAPWAPYWVMADPRGKPISAFPEQLRFDSGN